MTRDIEDDTITDSEIPIPITLTLRGDVVAHRQSNFDDVGDFHARFGLRNTTHGYVYPELLDEDLLRFRKNFMQEELDEFVDAHEAGDLAGAFDGLLDLVYVALGTAHMMGLPWQEGWDLVQAANMTKVRAPDAESSKRHHMFDVIKPEGFVPPDIEGLINTCWIRYDGNTPEGA